MEPLIPSGENLQPHTLRIEAPLLSTSFTFRVTKIKSCTNAVVAINPSIIGIGLPCFSSSPCKSPQYRLFPA
jgi:hypothetical protein